MKTQAIIHLLISTFIALPLLIWAGIGLIREGLDAVKGGDVE